MHEKQGVLLRIYVDEQDKYGSVPLYEWLVQQALDQGLAGATVLRGLEGYGCHHRLHTSKLLALSVNLPVVIEIVDEAAVIDAFLPTIDEAMTEGLVTRENVSMRVYGRDEESE